MSEELTREMTSALAPVDRSQFMPAMSIELAVERYNTITEFVSRVLRRDVDYGIIPGTDKLTLLKPGAEKLTTFFGLSTRFQLIERIEDWTGEDHNGEPFFYYLYRCRLFRGDLLVAEADGSCNSREQKYRYREAQRVCTECGHAAIIKGKEEYGGGWLCLQPDTPVLSADYVWRPIGEAKPGDEILGFDEQPGGFNIPRKFRPSVIEHVWASSQPTRRIITEDADIITTGGHRWLRHRPSNGPHWMPTDRLEVGRALRSIGICTAPIITDEYRMGYLAGMTLGDGTMRYGDGRKRPFYWRVALSSKDEVVLGRIVAYLAALGIEAYIRPFDGGPYSRAHQTNPLKKVEIRSLGKLSILDGLLQPRNSFEYKSGFVAGFFDAEGTGAGKHLRVYQNDVAVLEMFRRHASDLGFRFDIAVREGECSNARLRGDTLERIRFFNCVQPALLRKAGVYGVTMHHNESRILAIEDGPVMDVVDIQTSTGTFFAGGLATHNCFRKKGGCGAKFSTGDAAIESQQVGRVPNPEIADQVNTIQKMGQKRALVAVTLLAVNASEFFTQDVEDFINAPAVGVEATVAAPYDAEPVRSGPVIAGSRKFSSASDVSLGPKVEESDIRADILAACRRLGKTEDQLVDWLKRKYEIASIEELSQQQKREVLAFLHNKIARERAA
jgi:hypothetical protein